MIGGYTASRRTASASASVIFHYRQRGPVRSLAETTTWDVIVDHTALLVAFGVIAGEEHRGDARWYHRSSDRDYVGRYRACGGRLVSVSPPRDDTPRSPVRSTIDVARLAPVPGTDAIMLAGYVLATESLADRAPGRYCTGYERFERYSRPG